MAAPAATFGEKSAVEVVTLLTAQGFAKVCIVNKSYQVVGASAQDAVPAAWDDDDKKLVNENTELSKDWSKATDFAFFGKAVGKHKCIQKSALHIVASKGKSILIAVEKSNHWIVCRGVSAGNAALAVGKAQKKGKKGAKKEAKKKDLKNAPDAYNRVEKVFDDVLGDDESD